MAQHKSMIRTLRTVASFARVGAVLAGILLGWNEQYGDAFRLAGAAIGAIAAPGLETAHVL